MGSDSEDVELFNATRKRSASFEKLSEENDKEWKYKYI